MRTRIQKPKLAWYVSGCKGGTGKTVVAASTINYYRVTRGLGVELLETDESNPDTLALTGPVPYRCVKAVGSCSGWENMARLAQASDADVVVINARAGDVTGFDDLLQGQQKTESAVQTAKDWLADLLAQTGRVFVYMHVMRPEPINTFLARQALPWLPADTFKVAVLNSYHGNPDQFAHWLSSKTRELWHLRQGVELLWPRISNDTLAELYKLGRSSNAQAVSLQNVTDYELIAGKVRVDGLQKLPLFDRAALVRLGAQPTLLASIGHYERRVGEAIGQLEAELRKRGRI